MVQPRAPFGSSFLAASLPNVDTRRADVALGRSRFSYGRTVGLSRARTRWPSPCTSAAFWQRDSRRIAGHRFGNATGAGTAARLLGASIAVSTAAGYNRHWDKFVAFCRADNLSWLPAAEETIAFYIGYLYSSASIAGGSMRQYLARIAQRHVQCGYVPPPTASAMVSLVKAGFRRADHGRRGARTHHLPLPPTWQPPLCAMLQVSRHRGGVAKTAVTPRSWPGCCSWRVLRPCVRCAQVTLRSTHPLST